MQHITPSCQVTDSSYSSTLTVNLTLDDKSRETGINNLSSVALSLCSSWPCQLSTYMPQCTSVCFPTPVEPKSHHTWSCSHSGKALSFHSLSLLWTESWALELLPLRHGSTHLASRCYPRLLPPLTAASVSSGQSFQQAQPPLAFCIKRSPIAASLYFP